MEAPDTATLWRDDRKGEFTVVIEVRGTIRETVTADNEADARAKVEAALENHELELSGEDIDDARIDYVRANPPMYLVNREGRDMGVSHPRPGDEPREPNGAYEASKYRPPNGAA